MLFVEMHISKILVNRTELELVVEMKFEEK